MKILHIADLHIGKSIYGYSMVENGDQLDWIKKFIALCDEKEPDVVVVAGDIYDRAAPSAQAVVLLDYFVEALESRGIKLLMVAGNHDGGEKLEFLNHILERHDVVIEGTVKREIKKVTIPDEYGNVNFYLVPFLFPEVVSKALDDDEINSYEEAMRKLLEAQSVDFSERNVIIAHQNITANGIEAERGGSESMAGGIGQIDYTVFDGFEYVALGHIHSSYHVGRQGVRYAGTPLCYHLEETRQTNKGPLYVEIGAKNSEIEVHTEVITPLHRMRYKRGTRQEVYDYFNDDLGRGEYIGICITDEKISPEIYNHFKELFKLRDSVLMDCVSDFHGGTAVREGRTREEIHSACLEDLFFELYTRSNANIPPSNNEYAIMKKVAELTNRSDVSATIEDNNSNIDLIIDFAMGLEEQA